MTRSTAEDLATFESHRGLLVAHAYRMLGDLGRAEDIVQEAWLRWDGRQVQVSASREEHQRLLEAFTQAARAGDLDALVAMLAEDAAMITDGGPEGRRVAGIRNLQAPLHGPRKIAAFVAATARSADVEAEVHELNGQPALVLYDEDEPFAALLLAVADDRIHRVFFHADLGRLRYLGPRGGRS